mmetsp:Transcript_22527/g.58656  ORF Transcript_22527/g.58656 Transcript_22527/m.58656 type:complete len:177 (+) Transcript_22527:220-750(+)
MRLTALALHAHAATSRFTTAPTARFSVVVARAMSELVGDGEPTTTAEERAEAATLRTTEGAAAVAPTVAGCVFAGPGRQKYVLGQAGTRYFVRGDPRASYHMDAARPLVEELRAMEVAHEVLGGGRIQFEPEKKTIHIYGHSMGFPWQGEYRHDLSAKVCQEAYPDFAVTTSNEGY